MTGNRLTLMTLALASGLGAAPALADGHGEKLFKKCKVCHSVDKGGKNRVGPNLWGIVGQPSGQVAGYKYSRAMRKADLVWDEANLDKWLTKPKALVKGTRMAFPGFKKQQDRDAMIAYLKSKAD